LYEWDIRLIEDIDKISGDVAALQSAITDQNRTELPTRIRAAAATIQDFNTLFDKRIEVIGGVGV